MKRAVRVLVVGASGFVGAHTVRRLVRDGHSVAGFAPAPEPCLTEADLADIAFVAGDATAAGALDSAVASFAPEVVIGLAAHGGSGGGLMAAAARDPARARAVNVEGFRLLLESCLARRVGRVLWASTGAVFGDPALYPPDGAAGEDARPAPETEYGATKRDAEELARGFRRRGLGVTAVRLPLVFGPGLWYRGAAARLLALFEAAARGEPATLALPAGPLDLAYVKDVARAFSFLATAPGELDLVYNLAVCAPTREELVAALRALVPGFSVAFEEPPPGPVFPVMSGARLRALGFAPAWSLRDACADWLAGLRA